MKTPNETHSSFAKLRCSIVQKADHTYVILGINNFFVSFMTRLYSSARVSNYGSTENFGSDFEYFQVSQNDTRYGIVRVNWLLDILELKVLRTGSEKALPL